MDMQQGRQASVSVGRWPWGRVVGPWYRRGCGWGWGLDLQVSARAWGAEPGSDAAVRVRWAVASGTVHSPQLEAHGDWEWLPTSGAWPSALREHLEQRCGAAAVQRATMVLSLPQHLVVSRRVERPASSASPVHRPLAHWEPLIAQALADLPLQTGEDLALDWDAQADGSLRVVAARAERVAACCEGLWSAGLQPQVVEPEWDAYDRCTQAFLHHHGAALPAASTTWVWLLSDSVWRLQQWRKGAEPSAERSVVRSQDEGLGSRLADRAGLQRWEWISEAQVDVGPSEGRSLAHCGAPAWDAWMALWQSPAFGHALESAQRGGAPLVVAGPSASAWQQARWQPRLAGMGVLATRPGEPWAVQAPVDLPRTTPPDSAAAASASCAWLAWGLALRGLETPSWR